MKKPKQTIPENINDFYLVKDTLKMSEIACKCCNAAMIYPKLLIAWNNLRTKVEQPITINSGYRCWNHHVNIYKKRYPNDWEGRIAKYSKHLIGQALDLQVPNGLTAEEFMNIAKAEGFTYSYIISPTSIHVDVR